MVNTHLLPRLDIDQSPGGLINFATSATITASSSGTYNGVQTQPSAAIDGSNTPWVSAAGGAGQWILLTFPNRHQMNMVYLYDRGNPNDQIASGQLRFDDGSLVSFGPVNNDGSATSIKFPSLFSSSILFLITSVSQTTTDVGLTEFQVFFNSSVYYASPPSATRTGAFSTFGISGATDTANLGNVITTSFGSVLPTPTLSGVTSSSTNASGRNKKAFHIGPVAGAAAGGLVVLFLVSLFLCIRLRSKAKKKERFDIDGSYGEEVRPPPNNGGMGTEYTPQSSYNPYSPSTNQPDFARLNTPQFPSGPTPFSPPFIIHDPSSSPSPSPQPHPNSAAWTLSSTTALLHSPSLHQQQLISPAISSFSADSGARTSRPQSSISQGSYPMPVPSSGDAHMNRGVIQAVSGRTNFGSRPPPGSDMEKLPIEIEEDPHRGPQQALGQPSSSTRDATADTTGASHWNAWDGNAHPDDAPPRYEALKQ